jgi:hypothetical protein
MVQKLADTYVDAEAMARVPHAAAIGLGFCPHGLAYLIMKDGRDEPMAYATIGRDELCAMIGILQREILRTVPLDGSRPM